jgi:cell division protein ZapA (FtsZ GTPase activity inhibitor)
MKSDLKQYKIIICGQQYSLVSDESQAHVEAAAQYINEQMAAIAEKSKALDEKRMITFVALQLSSDMIKLRNEIEKNKLDQTNLLHSLEQAIDSLSS